MAELFYCLLIIPEICGNVNHKFNKFKKNYKQNPYYFSRIVESGTFCGYNVDR